MHAVHRFEQGQTVSNTEDVEERNALLNLAMADKAGLFLTRVLRWPQVRRITSLSRSTIWRMEREGRFPKRFRIGTRAVGWYAEEVRRFVYQQALSRQMVPQTAEGTLEK
jgi:prophage regulatory protein